MHLDVGQPVVDLAKDYMHWPGDPIRFFTLNLITLRLTPRRMGLKRGRGNCSRNVAAACTLAGFNLDRPRLKEFEHSDGSDGC